MNAPADTLERDQELDRSAAALDDAVAGRGRIVVIEGPPGIGKTRLVSDVRALAKVRGFGRVGASCDELESAMSWSVVRQMVERSVSRASGAEARKQLLAGPAGAALAAIDERLPGRRR
jgi:predicted ATPase